MPDETSFEGDKLINNSNIENVNLKTETGDLVITAQPEKKVGDLKDVPSVQKSGHVSDCATWVVLCCDTLTQCWLAFAACVTGCCDAQCCTECLNGTCEGFVECLQGCGECCFHCVECCRL